jgi:dihydrofolate synthase/folylpolyglutamate synthase
VIRKRCRETKAELFEVKKPLTGVKLPLVGKHQKINAAVAVAAVKALRERGFKISDASIREGLRQTLWPARCEVIGKNPLVILDGAQNASSAKAIKEAVKDNFQFEKLILVLGVSKDKDIKGICNELSDLADKVILTKADNPRALEPKSLIKYFKNKEIHLTASVKAAKRLAKKIAAKKDLILFTGSLFVAGEAR